MYIKAAQEDGDDACGYRVSLMALKCLNNAVWDQPAGQASFLRLGGLNMLVGLLQVDLIPCLEPCGSLWFGEFRSWLLSPHLDVNKNVLFLPARVVVGACPAY